MDRRRLLRNCGAVFSVTTTLGLAGCAGDDAGPGTAVPTGTGTPAATRTPRETSTPTGTPMTTECPDTGTPTTETLTPRETDSGRTSLESRISERGHYMWFALGEGTWGRRRSPYDIQESCSRWMAEPTANGGIRCFVNDINVDPMAAESAGFDLHLGPLEDIEEIRIPNEVIQSGQFNAQLAVALFLDEDEDGEFFVWGDSNGERERWKGFGGDEEAGKTLFAGETVVIDDDTQFRLFNRDSATASLGQLKNGEIEWLGDASKNKSRESGENREIDGDTNAAIYVGLVDNGDESAIEAIIQDVIVERA